MGAQKLLLHPRAWDNSAALFTRDVHGSDHRSRGGSCPGDLAQPVIFEKTRGTIEVAVFVRNVF